jgi:hypothetical protein
MWEFIGKLTAITVAANITLTWAIVVFAGTRKPRDPWPARENL